jgi:signal peptidase complex subunit 2
MAFIEEIADPPEPPAPRINNASLTDLKATSDDALPGVIPRRAELADRQSLEDGDLDYVQSHLLADIRLAIGYFGCLAAGVAALYEYKVGFKNAKGITLLGVALYFVSQAAFYLWQYVIERDIVYVGKRGNISVCHFSGNDSLLAGNINFSQEI